MLEAKSLARRGDDDDEDDVDEGEEGDEAAAAEKNESLCVGAQNAAEISVRPNTESLEAAKLEVSGGNGGEPKRRRKGRDVNEDEEAAIVAKLPLRPPCAKKMPNFSPRGRFRKCLNGAKLEPEKLMRWLCTGLRRARIVRARAPQRYWKSFHGQLAPHSSR